MKRDVPSYRGYRFPPEIISHAVWLYHRFGVSFRDVEDLLAPRGLTVSYEAIRLWCLTFGAAYARRLKRRQGRLDDTWHLDEVFVTIQGRRGIVRLIRLDPKNLQSRTIRLQVDATRPGRRLGLV